MNSTEFRSALQRRARHAAVPLAPDLIARFEAYFSLLARWNLKINLTALPLVRPTDETFDRLFIEPLAAAAALPDLPTRWFDLGSGGGSPAVPIKLAKPVLNLTMVESKIRKAAFLRDVVRHLELSNATVEDVRFETLLQRPELRYSAGLVTLRAVRIDEPLLDVCRYLLKDGGLLLPLGSAASKLPGFARTETGNLFVRQCST